MAVSRLEDPDEEDRQLFSAIRQRRTIRAVQAEPIENLTAEVNLITKWQQMYPDTPVGQVMSFARGGIDPATPEGRKLAVAGAKTVARKPGGFAALGENVHTIVKGAIRVPMAIMESPLQEVQGVIRGAGWGLLDTRLHGGNPIEKVAYGVGNAGRSTAWKAIEQIVKDPIGNLTPAATRPGAEVDLGEGFFSGGAVEEERRTDSERLVINEAPITTGRVVARRVSEPGTRPYNAVSGLIDAGVAITADPSAYVGRTSSMARRSAKTFAPVADATMTGRAAERLGEAVGLAKSHRLDVDPMKVEQWLMSETGRAVKQRLVAETDFDELRNLTGKKIPALVVRELADATDEQQVDNILGPLLGTVIRDKPTVGGLGYEVKRSLNGVRLAQRMPGSKLDLEDVDATIDTLDAFMRNAKLDDGLRKATLRRAVDQMASGNRQGMYNIVSDVMTETGGVLQRAGVDPARAKQMTQFVLDYNSTGAKYNLDEFAREQSLRSVVIDGVTVELPKPHLLSETLNRVVPLPDARDIRRMTSTFGRMLNNPAIDIPVTTLDWVMQDGWKPLTLLRGAWAVRVIGEEQVRMAASGLHSAFSHPLSYLGWMLAGDGVGAKTLGKAGITAGRGEVDVAGRSFMDTLNAADADSNPSEFLQSLSMRSAKHRGRSPRKQVLSRFDAYQRGTPEYIDSWADELLFLHNDDVARVVAQKGVDWTKAWFQRGAGDKYRQMLAQVPDNADLLTATGADDYIDTIAKRIHTKTGGDSALIDAIATGKVNGQDFLTRSASGKLSLNDAVKVDLDAYMRSGVGPVHVKGDMVVTASRNGEKLEQLDRALDTAFSFAMGVPTSKLSRSVAFKQNYWTRLEELVSYSDARTRQLIIDGAERADLPKDQIARIKGYVAKGDLSLEEADAIAKGHALEHVKSLLYDNSERSQFFDATRLIFPFGEAWKEVITRWGSLMLERPQNARRLQQTIEGARGSGFFHQNANEEEVFTYPFSRGITDKLIGVPVPLTGRVQGLSLMSEVMPGVGPVVQIPAGYLIPNKPGWQDFIRDQLLPFGEHETQGGFLESFLPPWLQKMQTAGYLNPLVAASPEQDRLFANTVGGLMDFMISSGEFSRPTTEEEMADLVDEATERAKHLYVIRGATQFFAPSAPSPEMLAADKSGNLMVAQRMIDDLHAMENDDANGGYDTAFGRWLDKYGDAAYTVAQPKSKMLVYGAPVTEDGEDWVRANGDIKRAFPNVYGFFAPTTGEFSFDAWRRVVESGEAEPLNPIERLKLANARIAREIFESEKSQFPASPSKDQRKYLSDFRMALEREYPGFGSVSGVGNKIETPDAITEIERAVANPKLAKTPQGRAVVEYLSARADAQADADALGLSGFQKAKAMAPTRDWLRQIASAITAETPDFAPIWEQLFERELTDDDVEEG